MKFLHLPALGKAKPRQGALARKRNDLGRDTEYVVAPYESGRLAAEAGKEIWANPFIGEGAAEWRQGYRQALGKREAV